MKAGVLFLLINAFLFPGSTLDKVKYTVLPEWVLLNKNVSDTLSVLLFHIKTDTINGNKHYSNALYQCYHVPDTVSIRHADGIVCSPAKSATLSGLNRPPNPALSGHPSQSQDHHLFQPSHLFNAGSSKWPTLARIICNFLYISKNNNGSGPGGGEAVRMCFAYCFLTYFFLSDSPFNSIL